MHISKCGLFAMALIRLCGKVHIKRAQLRASFLWAACSWHFHSLSSIGISNSSVSNNIHGVFLFKERLGLENR